MRLSTRILIVLLAIVVSISAQAADKTATRYKWKDAQGAMHFTDTLPAEALQFGYDVVNSQGMVIRHVDRALSPEERKTAAATAVAEQQAKQHDAEVARADKQMLIAYATEQDLAAVQKSKLDAIDQTIQNVRYSQNDQEKGLTEQLAHAETFERDGKPVPALVKQQIETLRRNIASQKSLHHAQIAGTHRDRSEIGRRNGSLPRTANQAGRRSRRQIVDPASGSERQLQPRIEREQLHAEYVLDTSQCSACVRIETQHEHRGCV